MAWNTLIFWNAAWIFAVLLCSRNFPLVEGTAVFEIGGVTVDIWSKKLCNEATSEQWIQIGEYKCYCKKYSIGFIVVISKFKLENCQAIAASTTQRPTTITPTHPPVTPPQFCSAHSTVDFQQASEYKFFGRSTTYPPPIWTRRKNAPPLANQNTGTSPPSGLILQQNVNGVDLEGSFFMPDDNDIVGVMFSFVNPTLFYLMSWKREDEAHDNINASAGVTLQLINSLDGLGGESNDLETALWTRQTLEGQATTLYENKTVSWDPKKNYRWLIMHRPSSGTIRFQIFEEEGTAIVDSRCIIEHSLKGGRFGVYSAYQVVDFNTFSFNCNNNALEC